MEDDTIDERLRAVERAVADDEVPDRIADAATVAGRLESAEATLDDVEDRLDDVEAAVEALRGYVGAVRGVNQDVERRADSALARVERLEADAAGVRHRSGGRAASRDADPGTTGDAARGRTPAPDHPIPDTSSDGHSSLRDRIADWL